MESLVADFVQFYDAFANFFNYWKEAWALGFICNKFQDFLKISSFPKLLRLKSSINSYIQFLVTIILLHFKEN